MRQPAYCEVLHRIMGELANSDFVMKDVFWIGVYSGLSKPMIEYILEALHKLRVETPREFKQVPCVLS